MHVMFSIGANVKYLKKIGVLSWGGGGGAQHPL